jgi:hypothetical protein
VKQSRVKAVERLSQIVDVELDQAMRDAAIMAMVRMRNVCASITMEDICSTYREMFKRQVTRNCLPAMVSRASKRLGMENGHVH